MNPAANRRIRSIPGTIVSTIQSYRSIGLASVGNTTSMRERRVTFSSIRHSSTLNSVWCRESFHAWRMCEDTSSCTTLKSYCVRGQRNHIVHETRIPSQNVPVESVIVYPSSRTIPTISEISESTSDTSGESGTMPANRLMVGCRNVIARDSSICVSDQPIARIRFRSLMHSYFDIRTLQTGSRRPAPCWVRLPYCSRDPVGVKRTQPKIRKKFWHYNITSRSRDYNIKDDYNIINHGL